MGQTEQSLTLQPPPTSLSPGCLTSRETLSTVLLNTDLRGRGFSKHLSCNRPSWVSAQRKRSEQLRGLSHCWIGKVNRTEGRSKQGQCCGTWASQHITDNLLTALHLLSVQSRLMEKHGLSHTGQLCQYLLTLLYRVFREQEEIHLQILHWEICYGI